MSVQAYLILSAGRIAIVRAFYTYAADAEFIGTAWITAYTARNTDSVDADMIAVAFGIALGITGFYAFTVDTYQIIAADGAARRTMDADSLDTDGVIAACRIAFAVIALDADAIDADFISAAIRNTR